MNALSIPKQATLNVFISATRNAFTNKTDIHITEYDRSEMDRDTIHLMTKEITVDLSNINCETIEINSLRHKQQKIADTAEREISEIEDRISDLITPENTCDTDVNID
ncbi:hypothetical protein [Martelella alba]|uniref:Uncharacterized protein n=1 Tax=Martelella alba TaxID=2590451 RepID=A0ABY2SE25_9HYPH|nr:hypothetical protein [Martelella alba]TKI02567.1 hypothetical protein FCN80_24590 [Martelella alba]